MKGKYLITTDNWFYAPDGNCYKATWGDVEIFSDEIIGIKTNRNSTNWFLKVGDSDNHVIIAGCQIHYAVKCKKRPNTKESIVDSKSSDGKHFVDKVTTRIYIAEKNKKEPTCQK